MLREKKKTVPRLTLLLCAKTVPVDGTHPLATSKTEGPFEETDFGLYGG